VTIRCRWLAAAADYWKTKRYVRSKMFWKKKQMAGSPATTGATTAGVVTPSATKVEASPKQKAEKPKVEKLPGPKLIPGPVEKHLVGEYKMDPDLVHALKAVVHKRPEGERAFDCRIFDPGEAEASGKQIKDYTSLDEHPDLILYEGWFDKESMRAELEEK
jgi:hypothetical protein